MGRPFLPRPFCVWCAAVCKDRGRTYCSRKCQVKASIGSKRPDAVGNKWALRENPTKWAHYKRMQKMCAPGPCVKCGIPRNSVIHHKDHDHTNTVPENLERLCRKHHIEEHREDLRHAA